MTLVSDRPWEQPLPWTAWAGLLVAPVLIFAGHLLYGLDQSLAAQWFVAIFAALAAGAAASPWGRKSLAESHLAAPGGLFLAVVFAVALSLGRVGPDEPGRAALFAALPPAGTINVSNTLLELSKLGGLACAFLIGCIAGGRRAWATATVNLVLACGGLYAALSLGLFFSGHQAAPGERLSAGFLSYNSAALVFGMLLVMAGAETLRYGRDRDLVRGSVTGGLTALFTICLYLTASRMGAAAAAAACAILVLWDSAIRRGLGMALLMIGAALAVAVGVVVMSGNHVLMQRLGTIDGDAVLRGQILASHWQAFLKAPLAGYGLGTFTEVNAMIMTRDNFSSLEPIRAMHNVYLQWLEEGGIIGALPMFCLIAWLLALAVRHGHHRGVTAALVRNLVAASLVVLFMGLSDFGLQVPSISVFWSFLLGLMYAVTLLSRRRRSSRA